MRAIAIDIFWSTCVLLGIGLIWWAKRSLPVGTSLLPVPVADRTWAGPYRFVRHPMYLGNLSLIVGLGGLAAGVWNAAALGVLAVLLMGEWAAREESAG